MVKSGFRRIVVTDDDPGQRTLMVDFLSLYEKESRYSFKIFQAEHGMQCIELMQRHHPQLVFLDFDMPRLNGLQVLQSINELHKKELGLIPIVMTTAHNDRETVEACIQAGASDYLVKPIDLPEFLKKIRTLV
jgi:CheY-like chemotaxis protein